MIDEQRERDRIVATLLAQAGISVPDEVIGKLRQMYWGAGSARSTLRSIQKSETEPMTIFAPATVANDE